MSFVRLVVVTCFVGLAGVAVTCVANYLFAWEIDPVVGFIAGASGWLCIYAICADAEEAE